MAAKISPLIVILGETASGKSALALNVAENWNGEIIAADSRTVYMSMNIGTAKPTRAEQARVPHRLLDEVKPDEKFSAALFKQSALGLINNISSRGKLPVMVGGTGLYIDSVLYDFDFHNTGAERDSQNPRHLKKSASSAEDKMIRSNTLVIGLSVPKEELKERITKRIEAMFKQGLQNEAKGLSQQYGWEAEAMSAVGYREWRAYFDGSQSLEETKDLIITHTLQYAKRQRTWFKRNKSIQWVKSSDEAMKLTEQFIVNQTMN